MDAVEPLKFLPTNYAYMTTEEISFVLALPTLS